MLSKYFLKMRFRFMVNQTLLLSRFIFRCCHVNCDGMLFFSVWCSERRRKRSQHVTSKVMYIYVNISDLDEKINVRIILCVINYLYPYLRNASFVLPGKCLTMIFPI